MYNLTVPRYFIVNNAYTYIYVQRALKLHGVQSLVLSIKSYFDREKPNHGGPNPERSR